MESGGALSCAGVTGSAQPIFAGLLHELFPKHTIVLVAENLKQQESFQQDLETWLGESPLFYPAWEVLPHEGKLPHADVISERLQTLVALAGESKVQSPKSKVVVTSVTALLQKTFPPADLKNASRTFARGDRANPLDLIEWLEAQGYEPEAQVTQKGELAMRGGIVDVFPPTSPWPVRLEFFGNELESLREFDPLTQVSRGEITSVTLPPAGELGILKRRQNEEGGMEKESALATLLDHLPRETIFILCEPEQLALRAEEYALQIPAGDPFFIAWPELLVELTRRKFTSVELSENSDSSAATPQFTSLDAFRPLGERPPEPQIAEAQRREFFAQLHRWLRQDYAVHVFCNTDGERQRFEEIWKDFGFDTPLHPLIGSLARGFICEEAKLVVVTDAEIFGRYKVQRPRRLKSPHAAAMRSAMEIDFADLDDGDLVVHLQHGIGRFRGLKNLPAGLGTRGKLLSTINSELSTSTECLVIEYAQADHDNEPPKLYVPVSEAHLVSKYVGVGKIRPPLHTLGGARWRKAVEQTETAVRDVAAELLRIQAVRESQPGHAFPADVTWQREFEGSFVFEETIDQVKAIAETKADMERAKPMDRLICGDVGFGKTEVAIRAAFKAVTSGKQVAILVPTTVLAEQHYRNIRERVSDYPITVGLLSRYRTRSQQAETAKGMTDGSVDIVIGTHRLISKDIEFKNLGLVVIDEEQRFGVLHKEKFKAMWPLVDMLTLSATPIPRTLYMSLMGAKDMSTIETPPANRIPVETIICPYDERVIRDAIDREIARNGQVYFLHNRVGDIELIAAKIKKLCPKARILIGHGQMEEGALEDVMHQFIAGEADVLIATTIIESGVDIPNANTIIIDRADRFGLADLYQLRGRVGRAHHKAYAYLMLPRDMMTAGEARKRIAAIKQYGSLGAGFKIAMRDLEIRGAGNILGTAQSGHIVTIGFDLYCALLRQAIAKLKGQRPKHRIDIAVSIDFIITSEAQWLGTKASDKAPAFIPSSYISETQLRIAAYRRLNEIATQEQLDLVKKEWRDRFGKIPDAAANLLLLSELKLSAAARKITAVETKDAFKLMLSRNGDFILLGGKFPRLMKRAPAERLDELVKMVRSF